MRERRLLSPCGAVAKRVPGFRHHPSRCLLLFLFLIFYSSSCLLDVSDIIPLDVFWMSCLALRCQDPQIVLVWLSVWDLVCLSKCPLTHIANKWLYFDLLTYRDINTFRCVKTFGYMSWKDLLKSFAFWRNPLRHNFGKCDQPPIHCTSSFKQFQLCISIAFTFQLPDNELE